MEKVILDCGHDRELITMTAEEIIEYQILRPGYRILFCTVCSDFKKVSRSIILGLE